MDLLQPDKSVFPLKVSFNDPEDIDLSARDEGASFWYFFLNVDNSIPLDL